MTTTLTFAQDQPTIAKDSVQITVHKYEHGPSRRVDAPPTWAPEIHFRVNGPAADGTRFWIEFGLPAKKKWLVADCGTRDVPAGQAWEADCSGRNEELSTGYTGPMDFAIHASNELAGTELTLFTGKAKIAKTVPPPTNKLYFDYYVDEDWRVPIGYLSHGRTLNIELWFRGKPGEVRPFIFFQGKQVAKGENCGGADFDPKAVIWWSVRCEFFSENDDFTEIMSKNPGDYEIKVLQEGRLARTATFTVTADGSYDNGVATANQLGSDRVILPFNVKSDPATWNRLAWKTEAYYGNPLTGFTVP